MASKKSGSKKAARELTADEKSADHYAILGVPRDASQEEIQAAYDAIALRLRPEADHDAAAQAELQGVNRSNDIIGDPDLRAKYDQATRATGASSANTASAATASASADARADRSSTAGTSAETASFEIDDDIPGSLESGGDYMVGQVVNHYAIYGGEVRSGFGRGVVVAIQEVKDGHILHIRFQDSGVGKRRIMASFAGLRAA